MTSEGYFKNLDIDLLKSYAAQWVQDFDYIEFKKIELRRYATPRRLAKHYSFNPKTLYAIVFHTKMREENGAVFNRFCAEIGYRQTVPDEKYSTLFGEDFKNVYQRGAFPGADYLDQWAFFPMAIGEGLPLSADNEIEPVVLYPSSLKAPDAKYVFAKTGPSWRIYYNGETLDALTGKGFKTIHFLVSRPGGIFTPEDLHNEMDGGTEELQETPSEIGLNDDIYDKRAHEELREHYRSLKAELQSAENDNDPYRCEKARIDLETFQKFYMEGFKKRGKPKKFVDNHKKLMKRYAQQIRRALKKIEGYKKVHAHLSYALKPIESNLFSYMPSEEIDWVL